MRQLIVIGGDALLKRTKGKQHGQGRRRHSNRGKKRISHQIEKRNEMPP